MLGEENILFMLVFVIGGIIFGALMMYLVMDARRSQQSAGGQTPTQPLTAPLPAEAQVPDTDKIIQAVRGEMEQASPTVDLERKKLVGFWRDKKTGQLWVQMEDEWFENIKLMDPVVRLQYELTLREASEWLDLSLMKAGMGKKVETPLSGAANQQAINLDEAPKRKLTIVEQVDEILQELLSESPLKEKKIRLSEIYNKGVVVWIGTHYFEGIDAVPDEEVKQLIKTAVKKWEVKNSGR
jgi:hypothetical protein